MQISKRLQAVADMVTSGSWVADIGTDHAYIPIFLAENGIIPRAIAMDVNAGPLARARAHIEAHGLSEKIETRLSDGLTALAPGEADCIVIAGMGGPLTIRILTEGKDRLAGCRELILQPQSEIRLVRAYLEQKGWRIVREEMVCEDGKYYSMMRAVPGAGVFADEILLTGKPRRDIGGAALPKESDQDVGEATLSKEADQDVGETASPEGEDRDIGETRLPGSTEQEAEETLPTGMTAQNNAELGMTEMELCFGPCLLRARHPVLHAYLLREQELHRRILRALEGQTGEAALQRDAEVRQELRLIEEGLELYSGKEAEGYTL